MVYGGTRHPGHSQHPERVFRKRQQVMQTGTTKWSFTERLKRTLYLGLITHGVAYIE